MYKLNKYSLNERYDNLSLCDAKAVDEIAHNITLSSTTSGYTQGADTTTATKKWIGGVLTPSGKVVMIPSGYRYIGIYDPVENTYTQGADTSTVTNKWIGGVLTPSGKVVMIPLDYQYIGIYDPVTNTYTQGPGTSTTGGKWIGGVLTPSGKVVMIPSSYQYIGIYNNGYVSKNPTAHLSAYTNKF